MPAFTSFRRVQHYFEKYYDSNDERMWFVEKVNGLRLWIKSSDVISTYEVLQQQLQHLFRLFGFQEDVQEIPSGYLVTYE